MTTTRGYWEAIAKDAAAAINHHRRPWEIEADAFAAAVVDVSEMMDAADSLACLFNDAARYRSQAAPQ